MIFHGWRFMILPRSLASSGNSGSLHQPADRALAAREPVADLVDLGEQRVDLVERRADRVRSPARRASTGSRGGELAARRGRRSRCDAATRGREHVDRRADLRRPSRARRRSSRASCSRPASPPSELSQVCGAAAISPRASVDQRRDAGDDARAPRPAASWSSSARSWRPRAQRVELGLDVLDEPLERGHVGPRALQHVVEARRIDAAQLLAVADRGTGLAVRRRDLEVASDSGPRDATKMSRARGHLPRAVPAIATVDRDADVAAERAAAPCGTGTIDSIRPIGWPATTNGGPRAARRVGNTTRIRDRRAQLDAIVDEHEERDRGREQEQRTAPTRRASRSSWASDHLCGRSLLPEQLPRIALEVADQLAEIAVELVARRAARPRCPCRRAGR